MAVDGQSNKRRKAERRGHAAEYWAALYLLLKGYRILAIRYRTRLGEIDLIARKRISSPSSRSRRALPVAARWMPSVFIRSSAFGRLPISGSPAAGMPAVFSLRFDIVAVLPRRLPQHFIDAF